MIRRLRRRLMGGGRPEAALWDHLDACGIDFRTPVKDLVERHGTHPLGWADDVDICLLKDARPFVKGQIDPMVVDVAADTDLMQPPTLLRCAVRETDDFRLNYARAIAALVKLFGQGDDATTQMRVGRCWSFGAARLDCFVVPPDRVRGDMPSKRNLMFPDRAAEAAIRISPAFQIGPDPS